MKKILLTLLVGLPLCVGSLLALDRAPALKVEGDLQLQDGTTVDVRISGLESSRDEAVVQFTQIAIDTASITSEVAQLKIDTGTISASDGTKVLKAGDTMTGELVINSGEVLGDVATGGTPSVQYLDYVGSAADLFDKNVESYWGTLTIPAWAQYQLPIAYTVLNYSIRNASSNSYNKSPTAWTLQGSNNGSSFTTIDTVSGLTWVDGETKNFTVDTAGSYLYYRLNMTASNGTFLLFNEFYLYANVPSPSLTANANVIANSFVGSGSSLTGITASQVSALPTGQTVPANLIDLSTVTTAIGLKANIASPTFTGTVGGITASMVGALPTGQTVPANLIDLSTVTSALVGKLDTNGNGSSLTGITASQVGAVAKSGDTMTGDLMLRGTQFNMRQVVIQDSYTNYIDQLGLTGNASGYLLLNTSGNTSPIYLTADVTQPSYIKGRLGIGGLTNPSVALEVTGSIVASSSITASAFMVGYERVTNACASNTTCVATCTGSNQVMGGGCSASPMVSPLQGYPSSITAYTCDSGVTGNLTAYALCGAVQ